jgi:hypothetical protein
VKKQQQQQSYEASFDETRIQQRAEAYLSAPPYPCSTLPFMQAAPQANSPYEEYLLMLNMMMRQQLLM